MTEGAGPPSADPPLDVICGDGLAWLASGALPRDAAVVTSLPDACEMRSMDDDAWREWFVAAAEQVIRSVADDSVAIFYQTDVRRGGAWTDKAHLVATAADRAGAACLFHKIVCRVPAGTATFGRPGYAHLLAWSRSLRPSLDLSTADVLPSLGQMTWARATGTAACEEACRFLVRATHCRTVADPFCGLGTVLAVARAYGLGAIGVERSPKRAERARRLRFVRGTGIV